MAWEYNRDCSCGGCRAFGTGEHVNPPKLASRASHEAAGLEPRCDGRYPVPMHRDEPFPVTYRCGLEAGHQGEHGSGFDSPRPIASPDVNSLQPIAASAERVCLLCGDKESAHTKKEADWRTVPGCTGSYLEAAPPPPACTPLDFTTCSIIELAIRNPNVASYMNEWEGRVTQAEAKVASLSKRTEKHCASCIGGESCWGVYVPTEFAAMHPMKTTERIGPVLIDTSDIAAPPACTGEPGAVWAAPLELDRLADRLEVWAQNEEMIDASFTAHGTDCIKAATILRQPAAPPASDAGARFTVAQVAKAIEAIYAEPVDCSVVSRCLKAVNDLAVAADASNKAPNRRTPAKTTPPIDPVVIRQSDLLDPDAPPMFTAKQVADAAAWVDAYWSNHHELGAMLRDYARLVAERQPEEK